MKKITLSLIAIVFTINFSYAQWNSSGNNIYNTNTGAVGIGTTAPTAKLGVVGPSGNTIYSAQAGSGGEWAFGPNVGSTSGDDTFGIYSYTWGSAHSSKPLMQFNSTGNTFLNPDGGKVGIGTISPGVKLDVAGSVNISNGFNLTWGGAFGVGTPAMEGTGGTGLIFYPNGSTSGESMRISASGNVGIGTTSPAAKLQTNYLF